MAVETKSVGELSTQVEERSAKIKYLPPEVLLGKSASASCGAQLSEDNRSAVRVDQCVKCRKDCEIPLQAMRVNVVNPTSHQVELRILCMSCGAFKSSRLHHRVDGTDFLGIVEFNVTNHIIDKVEPLQERQGPFRK